MLSLFFSGLATKIPKLASSRTEINDSVVNLVIDEHMVRL